jgi:hypothetical protein
MNKLVIFFVLLMAVATLGAQDKEKNAPPPRPANVVTRMVRLQHADPRQVQALLSGTGAHAYWDNSLRLVVVSGTPSEVASLEQTIHEIDAETAKSPASNVELTIYVIGAGQEANQESQIPSGLQSTVDQLKPLFPYRSFRVLETAVVRARVGTSTRVNGSLQPFDESKGMPPSYDLNLWLAGISGSASKALIRLQQFRFMANFWVTVSTQTQQVSAQLNTDFDLTTGQKVVVGKASVAGHALFLVVEGKVVD